MLVDVEPTLPVDDFCDDVDIGEEALNEVLDMFVEEIPERVGRGLFVSCGFNPAGYFERYLSQKDWMHRGDKLGGEHPEFPRGKPLFHSADGMPFYKEWVSYCGVCDSPEQFMERFGRRLERDPRKFIVHFTRVRKADQGGLYSWRWHKWGPYVGKGKPTTEYLYDEPKFEEVYCYHIFEIGGECELAEVED